MALRQARCVQLKRALDVSLSLLGLIAILPILLVVAIAIWVGDRGPVFFVQDRVGRDRRTFRMFKFRSMGVHAERETGPTWSWAGDPRVTSVGRVLRATHLDELPQLWNVLRGEMSLVGPRPEREVFVAQLEQRIPGYAGRHAIRPGITGLSQLRSGYDDSLRTVRRKVRYDLLYARKASASLDALILADTVLLPVRLSAGLALRKLAVAGSSPRRHAAALIRSQRPRDVRVLNPAELGR